MNTKECKSQSQQLREFELRVKAMLHTTWLSWQVVEEKRARIRQQLACMHQGGDGIAPWRERNDDAARALGH